MLDEPLDGVLRVEEEHRNLNLQMGQLKLFALQDPQPENYSIWRLEFVGQMQDFEKALVQHFSLEEKGGFLQEILSQAPESKQRVEKLRVEHAQILLTVNEIISRATGMMEKNTDTFHGIRLQLNEIIAHIHEHESDEHHLMQLIKKR